MRGVRALRKAPQVLLLALLASCDFSFKIKEPAIELGVTAAYSTGKTFSFSYKFITDESVLRCRYAVNSGSQVVLPDSFTGLLTPGVLYWETIDIPDGYGEGNYLLHLVGQVQRGGSFVDMASLSQTVEIGIDLTRPLPPDVGIPLDGSGRYGVTDLISLDHTEWPDPDGGPVRLVYNFDAEPSVEVPPQAGEIQIRIPSTIVVDPNTHSFQVTAIDEAGNEKLAPSRSFRFLKIESVRDEITQSNSAKIDFISNLAITGYNFSTSDAVRLYDYDGTEVPLWAEPIIGPTSITVSFNLHIGEELEPDIDTGWGELVVVTTPLGTSATFDFEITP